MFFTLSLILLVFLPALAAKAVLYNSTCTVPNDFALNQGQIDVSYSRATLLGGYHKGRFNSVSDPLYVVMFFGVDQAATTTQPMPEQKGHECR